MFDLEFAIDLLVPNAKYGDASNYDRLCATWKDSRRRPSSNELTDAYLEWRKKHPRRPVRMRDELD